MSQTAHCPIRMTNSLPGQDPETLKTLRIDPAKDNAYISPDSQHNFETRNEDEFGDDIGLNTEVEAEYFKELGYPYYHMPFGKLVSL